MQNELAAISEFVTSNARELARHIRHKLLAAGAKPYLDRLGKVGIEDLERESAGVLLDLACALLRRLDTSRAFQPEEILAQLPQEIRDSIRLPRSEAYYAILKQAQSKPQ